MTKHLRNSVAVNSEQWLRYVKAGWQLIPLHRYSSRTEKNGKIQLNGKRPLDFNWTVRPYDSKSVIAQCTAKNRNIGVRLTEAQLVIDVDPRNGGTRSFRKLCRKLKLNPDQWPQVHTGAGGDHYYLTLPNDVRVVDTLPGFPGVEFKSKGRQVVAAGSIHPETHEHYEWDWLNGSPSLNDAPEAPARLIEAIRRPERDQVEGGGQYSQEQIAQMLNSMDVMAFHREHDRWFALMCACHHASNGDARQEFIEWCIGDPEYADQSDQIGRRWDSLHKEKKDGFTYKTLIKFVTDSGDPSTIPAPDPSNDFDAIAAADDDSWLEGGAPQESWLEKMNRKYCGLVDGGKYRISYPMNDPDESGRIYWEELSVSDFHSSLSGQTIAAVGRNGTPTEVPVSEAWHEHPQHRRADGATINPTKPPLQVFTCDAGHKWLNQWSGWGVTPRLANSPWKDSRLRQLIFDVLCSGKIELYRYLMNWLAWKIQHPGEPTGVAVVLRGEKGVGKTTLGTIMVKLFGSHGIVLQSVDQLAGRFSGHLKTACFVFGDECFWGGNKQHEGTLKKLITDSRMMFEAKFKQAVNRQNRMAIMLATNDEWAVPASLKDERRFFVLDVSGVWRVPQGANDHPNQVLWNGLYAELDAGGREAFLHHLLTRKLTGHPRNGVPQTEALAEQKLHTLEGPVKWYHDCLQSGCMPALLDGVDQDWETKPIRVKPQQLTQAYAEWLGRKNPHANVSAKGLLKKLQPFGWKKDRSTTRTRKRYWEIPALPEARLVFSKALGVNPFDDECSEGPDS
jgi:hypothetical protein